MMPQAVQGMVIGLLISLLVGIIIGFYLRQGRINALAAALKTSQGREQGLQQEHEERLRAAIAQLQQDYEGQLADKIERYQRQYEAQLQQLEAEYEARQNLIPTISGPPSADPQDPDADSAEGWDSAPISEYEASLRQQYEARLKENTYKIQQAYEQYLRESLATAREAQQQEYDQRLTEAIARYQDEAEDRLAEALKEQEAALLAGGNGADSSAGVDETQVQERLATLEAELRSTYDRRLAERIEQYQDEMSQRIAQLEDEFAARLQMAQAAQPADEPPLPLEPPPTDAALEAHLQAEYDQRLAEVVARHQDELTGRLQALTEEYEARLQMAQAGGGEAAEPDTAALEDRLRQEIEAELRAEYDLQVAEKLEQFQADLNQRAQDFEAGLIATVDPFVDSAVEAESLEDSGLDLDGFGEPELEPSGSAVSPDVDPFPDLEAFQSATAPAPVEASPPSAAPPLDEAALNRYADSDVAELDDLGDLDFSPAEDGPAEGPTDWNDLEFETSTPEAEADNALDALSLEDTDLEAETLGEANELSEPDATLNLDTLDLSTLSDDDLAASLGDDEDLFDLETLAKRAGVDLEELNNLLNQPDPAAPEANGDRDPFGDDNWSTLS